MGFAVRCAIAYSDLMRQPATNCAARAIGNWHSESDTPRRTGGSIVPLADLGVLILRVLLAVAPVAIEYQQKRQNAEKRQDDQRDLGACREGQDKPT